MDWQCCRCGQSQWADHVCEAGDYDEISLTFTAVSLSLCCVCSYVVNLGLSMRLSWYSMWMRWLLWQWCVYCCLCCVCVSWKSVRVRGWRQCWWMRCSSDECRACEWYTFKYCVQRSWRVVRGMRGGDGVCEMCMYLARGDVGGGGLYQSCGNKGSVDVCLCLACGGVGGVGGEWVRCLNGVWRDGVVLCLGELWGRISCVDGRSRYLYIVRGGYLPILGAPVFNTVAPYGYMLPTVYLFIADIANPDLFVCGCRTRICLDITRFYEE